MALFCREYRARASIATKTKQNFTRKYRIQMAFCRCEFSRALTTFYCRRKLLDTRVLDTKKAIRQLCLFLGAYSLKRIVSFLESNLRDLSILTHFLFVLHRHFYPTSTKLLPSPNLSCCKMFLGSLSLVNTYEINNKYILFDFGYKPCQIKHFNEPWGFGVLGYLGILLD